jgi:hypothetical protein
MEEVVDGGLDQFRLGAAFGEDHPQQIGVVVEFGPARRPAPPESALAWTSGTSAPRASAPGTSRGWTGLTALGAGGAACGVVGCPAIIGAVVFFRAMKDVRPIG